MMMYMDVSQRMRERRRKREQIRRNLSLYARLWKTFLTRR